VSTEGEKHAEFKRRRDEYSYMKVPAGGETPYVADGWEIEKTLKRQIRLKKQKPLDRRFEDLVWRLFYRMGYGDLNKGHDFKIRYRASDGSSYEKQVDIFCKDGETVVIGECKCCDEYKNRSLGKDLAETIGLKKAFANAIRAHYGRDFKPKILWFYFTDKVLWNKPDRRKADSENIHVMTERELDYFSQLAEHLGRATKYQFLAEYLGGQKIPEMRDSKVPAIRGKLGGKVFYSFVSTAEQLLKICFVNHRTLADPLALPTYQRMVKRARLRSIGDYLKSGGYFPTNILINFDERRPFDRKGGDANSDVQFGDLHLPERYKSAWIVDGQHRLYGYSVIDPRFSKQNIAVIAFEGLKREEEANLFVTINHEQKSVPRTLLDELDADLKWGSTNPTERLAAMSARIVQMLAEEVGGPLFRRVIAQGIQGDDVMCLTMPELKGGIVRSHLIGSLAQKRKLLVDGALTGDSDLATVKRASATINAFLLNIRSSNSTRWDQGREGDLSTNVGLRALLMLLNALIGYTESKKKNFDARNASPEEIIDAILPLMSPLAKYLQNEPNTSFKERFGRTKYGSGGPPTYFYELSQIIHDADSTFSPDGLLEHIASKDNERVETAAKTISFIENRVSDIIFDHFKKLHGDKYWNQIGTPQMRVKAYERQQSDEPDKQLDIEAYLDFIDKKKIIEKQENWDVFKKYFNIPLPGEKGQTRNLRWMDRLNELRRVVAHSHKRAFTSDDLDFLEWIRSEFEARLLEVA
jgi:DNA sulfur modification protein DndB